jgi:hypothetical protein
VSCSRQQRASHFHIQPALCCWVELELISLQKKDARANYLQRRREEEYHCNKVHFSGFDGASIKYRRIFDFGEVANINKVVLGIATRIEQTRGLESQQQNHNHGTTGALVCFVVTLGHLIVVVIAIMQWQCWRPALNPYHRHPPPRTIIESRVCTAA